MEANLILIEFSDFCLIIRVIYIYKNLNVIEISKAENGSLPTISESQVPQLCM